MMDYFIYHNIGNKKHRFFLLYGIYGIMFFSLCYLMNMKLNLEFCIKALSVITLFTLVVAWKIKQPVKTKAVMTY